jgi:hypothetical protein
MVTKLQSYKRDPNGLGRGPGLYYLRGGKTAGQFTLPSGKTVKGPYYSKYSQKRDSNRRSEGWKTDVVGIPKNVASRFAHISDGNLTGKRWR